MLKNFRYLFELCYFLYVFLIFTKGYYFFKNSMATTLFNTKLILANSLIHYFTITDGESNNFNSTENPSKIEKEVR